MKKLSTALLVITALMASGAQARWRPNWLLGISGTYNWIKHESNEDGFLINGINETIFDIGAQENKVWGWGLFGGYQARCNCWTLGAELAVDWIKSKDDDNIIAFRSTIPARSWVGSASFSRDYILALTGRLGYDVYSYLMLYARAGIETSRDKISFSISTGDVLIPFITATSDSHVQSWRFVGGIGAEAPLPFLAGLSLRGEWNFYSNGRAIDATALSNDSATLISIGGKQEINTARLSLVYYFPACC